MTAIVRLFGAGALALAAASCATAPFSYAEDRCTGAQNRCQNTCAGLNDGPARSACIQRCQMQESQCRVTGDNSASALAVDNAIGRAKSQREKEAGYERWKAEKAKKEKEQQQENGNQ